MSTLKGPVRFRFRVPEEDVDVLIQGDAEWVSSLREDLGLTEVGWVQPFAFFGKIHLDKLVVPRCTICRAPRRRGRARAGLTLPSTVVCA